MTLAELETKGRELHWSHMVGPHQAYNREQHRWYFCDGMLYECIRNGERRAGPWRVFEIELTRTGREWGVA